MTIINCFIDCHPSVVQIKKTQNVARTPSIEGRMKRDIISGKNCAFYRVLAKLGCWAKVSKWWLKDCPKRLPMCCGVAGRALLDPAPFVPLLMTEPVALVPEKPVFFEDEENPKSPTKLRKEMFNDISFCVKVYVERFTIWKVELRSSQCFSQDQEKQHVQRHLLRMRQTKNEFSFLKNLIKCNTFFIFVDGNGRLAGKTSEIVLSVQSQISATLNRRTPFRTSLGLCESWVCHEAVPPARTGYRLEVIFKTRREIQNKPFLSSEKRNVT